MTSKLEQRLRMLQLTKGSDKTRDLYPISFFAPAYSCQLLGWIGEFTELGVIQRERFQLVVLHRLRLYGRLIKLVEVEINIFTDEANKRKNIANYQNVKSA